VFVPRYWSEASHCERLPGRRQMTLRRFGWSSSGQEDAKVHARQRLEEALAVLRRDGPDGLRDFTRRERAVAYAGSDGLPIREEVVREHEDLDVVITRNVYGALCLNTTRAMFVDVDRAERDVAAWGCLGAVAGLIVGAAVALLTPGFPTLFMGIFVGIAAFTLLGWVVCRVRNFTDPLARNPLQWAIDRAKEWCAAHPAWRVAIYETPAGARLLPVHDTFDAGDEKTFEFMDFVRADPLYQRMCRIQKCFRARVSPKPWRIGVEKHFKAGGTWPVRDPEKLQRRADWIAKYERLAGSYASCRTVDTVGEGRSDSRIEAIRSLHDDLCQANSRGDLA
jgi:hypothetical protein